MEYKDTIFLPKTSFEMRANLPMKEPKILEEWNNQNIFKKLREKSKGREKFVLHDGPPYANGHIHMGTALNKILKDVIVRTQQMTGKDSIFVPGWDCHGLPIEWKIEEEYRKKGKNKDDVPVVQFRQECREFAEKWIAVQKKEFRRLGIEGDWDNPYLTMSNQAEAQIVRELGKFLLDESLYKGARPVLWSVVEKTALADAEVEYEDHTSNTIYVRFKVTKSSLTELIDTDIVIWTTTPWTIPGNRALAYGKDLEYALVEVQETEENSLAQVGDLIVLAKELQNTVLSQIGVVKKKVKQILDLDTGVAYTPNIHSPGMSFTGSTRQESVNESHDCDQTHPGVTHEKWKKYHSKTKQEAVVNWESEANKLFQFYRSLQ